MRLISVSGYKDTGKTTLCRGLLAELAGRGYTTGYIKRTQEFIVYDESTDSGSVAALGSDALLWGEDSFRLESRSSGDIDPYRTAARFFPDADVVLIEGGKNLALPKIWVLGQGEERPQSPGIFALYNRHGAGNGGEVYGEDEVGRLVGDIGALIERGRKSAHVFLEDVELPMKDFVADFISGGVRGMLASLKNPTSGSLRGRLRIFLKPEE